MPVQAWHAADCPGCGPAGHLLHGDWAVHQAARPRPRPGQARHAAGASQCLDRRVQARALPACPFTFKNLLRHHYTYRGALNI